MATPRSQRIGIWIIAIVMAVGTIGSFAVIILSTKNNAADDARLQELTTQYQTEYEAYQKKVDAQAKQLSKQYYSTFKQYASLPAAFNKGSVEKLNKKDLKVGTGEKLTAESSFSAYYIGWNPDGKVIANSIEKNALSAPIAAAPGGVIAGWSEGVAGMRVGGVRELIIPAELAYKDAGRGEDIPPNTPLKYVIMVIPTPKAIEEPQPSEELIQLYSKRQQ